MYEYGDGKPCCDFHPKEVIIGVCPLCLNERLLILAAKQQSHHLMSPSKGTTTNSYRSHSVTQRNHHNKTLPKIFAIGSFLNPLKFRHKKFDDDSNIDFSSSQEDSFISIKFENNEVTSWEKSKVSKVSLDHCNVSWNHISSLNNKEANKSVVEHAKPYASLRWQKRIGHLFQRTKWRKGSKGNVSHVSTKLEGVKVRSGWIRSLTKRRTKE